MRASGNGRIKVCVNNLLRIFRGENPYERVKGMDPTLIDQPIEAVRAQAVQDAWRLIEIYEPRATIRGITASPMGAPGGGLYIEADIIGEGVVTNG